MAGREQVVWSPAKNETGVVGHFGYEEILDIPASEAKDEKVYKQVLCLYAKVIGSNEVAPPQKVHQANRAEYIARFPEAWEAFQKGERAHIAGTPLSDPFHGLTLLEPEVLKFQLNGLTAWEQIADLTDAQCGTIGFGTRKKRDEVMTAMGRQVPGKPPKAAANVPNAVGDAPGANEPAGVAVEGTAADSSPAPAASADEALPRRRPGRPRKAA
jgi:hypothetical protein